MTSKQTHTIAQRIDRHLTTHVEDAATFAAALGIREATLKLLRNGTSKLPYTKVPAVAAVMKLDPYKLLRDVMGEYEPKLLELLDALWDRSAATANQRRLLELYDRGGKGAGLVPGPRAGRRDGGREGLDRKRLGAVNAAAGHPKP